MVTFSFFLTEACTEAEGEKEGVTEREKSGVWDRDNLREGVGVRDALREGVGVREAFLEGVGVREAWRSAGLREGLRDGDPFADTEVSASAKTNTANMNPIVMLHESVTNNAIRCVGIES